jgi:regulator of replication initiation timing
MQLQKLGDINFELKDSLVNLSDITVKLKNDLKQSRNLLNDAKKEAESVAEYNTVLKGDIDKLKYELEQKSKELKKSECKNKLYGGISIVAIFASILTVVVMH